VSWVHNTSGDRIQHGEPSASGEWRSGYPHFLEIQTQWRDNDQYGHVNNVVYYAWMDTVINDYLIKKGGLQPTQSEIVGYCVESQCRFKQSTSFPDKVECGLRVGKLGTSSVTYHLGFFKEGTDAAIAHGHFVHVFVNKNTNRPTPIPQSLRDALLALVLPSH